MFILVGRISTQPTFYTWYNMLTPLKLHRGIVNHIFLQPATSQGNAVNQAPPNNTSVFSIVATAPLCNPSLQCNTICWEFESQTGRLADCIFFTVWKFRGGLFGSSGLLALSALFHPSGFVFLLSSGMWHHWCCTGTRIDDTDDDGSRLLWNIGACLLQCMVSRLKIKWFKNIVVGIWNPLGLFSIVHCDTCSLVGL